MNSKNTSLTTDELNQILDIARYAPSVHNSQPWKVQPTDYGMSVSIDANHRLGAGDPTGRQTTISLGIFCEAILVAAKSIGKKINKISFGEQISIYFGSKSHGETAEAKALKTRASDRSIYQKTAVDEKFIEIIESSSNTSSVKIWVINDEKFIEKVARLTARGVGLALANPEFRKELSRYLVRSRSKKNRGINVGSLYLPYALAQAQPEMVKFGLGRNKEAELEKERWLSASAIVLITSEGDLHKDWFEAGRAYLRASLNIEKLGLSQASSAATVEASTFHEDVEKMLNTNQRLQAVIRIGRGVSNRQYSPRISPDDMIT